MGEEALDRGRKRLFFRMTASCLCPEGEIPFFSVSGQSDGMSGLFMLVYFLSSGTTASVFPKGIRSFITVES